jgi:energy-converting hydrogenase Eha subunit A
VTNCPSKPYATTEVVAISTTVCPVDEEEPERTALRPSKVIPTPVGTISATTIIPTDRVKVTAAAGRIGGALDIVAAAAAGVVAVALL